MRRASPYIWASLLQELKECGKDSVVKVSLVSESDLLHWKGHIKGPEGTPYEGGMFCIDINLPADYPFVPPKVVTSTLDHAWCTGCCEVLTRPSACR